MQKFSMITYHKASTPQELQQILELQAQNHSEGLPLEEMLSQGFVTVKHDLELLQAMNSPYQHIIAKANGQVVGFALVMLKEFGDKIPVLVPMFELIDQLDYKGKPLRESNYFVMGQICIDKRFRGQGVFPGLYHALKAQMQPYFDLLVTEIAVNNTRSLKAHANVGFKSLQRYSADGLDWDIVIWDWS